MVLIRFAVECEDVFCDRVKDVVGSGGIEKYETDFD